VHQKWVKWSDVGSQASTLLHWSGLACETRSVGTGTVDVVGSSIFWRTIRGLGRLHCSSRPVARLYRMGFSLIWRHKVCASVIVVNSYQYLWLTENERTEEVYSFCTNMARTTAAGEGSIPIPGTPVSLCVVSPRSVSDGQKAGWIEEERRKETQLPVICTYVPFVLNLY